MTTKLRTSRTLSATFEASPCSEDDRAGVGHPKGWCSERVPVSSYRARRYVAASGLMPFSNGRTLPSKWDDAERWISSPVCVTNASTNSYYATGVARTCYLLHHHHHCQRRVKSKSGPLGSAGLVSYGSFNSYSPVLGMGVINGGKWRNSVGVESSALGPAQLDDEVAVGGREGGRRSCPGHGGPDWLDLWTGPPSPSHDRANTGDDNIECMDDDNINNNDDHNYSGEEGVDGSISRRDMATQMFPGSDMSSTPSSIASSPRSSVSTNSPRPLLDEDTTRNVSQSPESEVRDVQVDKQASTTRRPTSNRDQPQENPSISTLIETDKKISKLQREESRINAWENLQKAKAEEAIHKLEMKLEKKRSSSMEKIIERLRRAEIKAQKMRSSLSRGDDGDDDDDDQIQSRAVARTTSKLPSFCRKMRLTSSSKSCSTCYPFL